MANSLFGLNKPNTDLRKNVFDLSQKSLFSMSAGMLLPCLSREMNPGEKAQISVAALTRTQPLNTAAFVRCRQFFHFFFVPYKQLWSGWDNFINGVDYKTSAFQDDIRPLTVPRLELFKALSALLKDGYIIDKDAHRKRKGSNKHPRSTFIRPRFRSLGTFERTPDHNSNYVSENTEERSGYMDINDYGGDLGPDFNRGCDEFGIDYYRGISRLLDMLEYGISDLENVGEESVNTLSDMIMELERKDSNIDLDRLCRILDNENFCVNPFRLLAYQKIYNDFYKRDDYESTDPLSFNVDDVADFINTDLSSVSGVTLQKRYRRLLGMLRLRYRWLPKDYFTGVVPSELYNRNNSIKMFYDIEESKRTFPERARSLTEGLNLGSSMFSHEQGIYDKVDIRSDVSTKSIRAAFAIEKLLRLTRRAGGFDYISQTAAHYGFEPPKGRGDKVQFLGGFTNDINVSEVITTANTEQGVTGQVFGKGMGAMDLSKDIEFTAPEHGVLMCITSVVPDLDYNADGLSRFNAKFDRGDYFHPEFQDLGLQPVFGYELKNPWRTSDLDDSQQISQSDYRSSILGFVPMYSEYKTAYDKLHGDFRNGKGFSAWSGSQMLDYVCDSVSSGLVVSTLKVNPHSLDRVFSIAYDGREMTDQFMVNAQFVVKMIRPMSITGQQL